VSFLKTGIDSEKITQCRPDIVPCFAHHHRHCDFFSTYRLALACDRADIILNTVEANFLSSLWPSNQGRTETFVWSMQIFQCLQRLTSPAILLAKQILQNPEIGWKNYGSINNSTIQCHMSCPLVRHTERKLWYPQLRIPGLHSYKSNSLYVIAGHND
jgi:hypothetical protein